MNETQSRRSIGRSVLAVLAGIAVGAALSIGTDSLLRAAGIFPKLGQQMSDGLFGLATAYRIVYGILGSYVIARLAPSRPMQHALIGGVLGLVVGIIGAVATWNRDMGPHWYAIAIAVTALPCAWAGGKLRIMQARVAISA
ncbi:MAG: hypothetical protein DMG94_04800 [Acidobacteria bacterium]|nr:MAG: hypothetical protein DMG94_04800 [Acidobacteriota bacterium]